jgi:hypothetical protein
MQWPYALTSQRSVRFFLNIQRTRVTFCPVFVFPGGSAGSVCFQLLHAHPAAPTRPFSLALVLLAPVGRGTGIQGHAMAHRRNPLPPLTCTW